MSAVLARWPPPIPQSTLCLCVNACVYNLLTLYVDVVHMCAYNLLCVYIGMCVCNLLCVC